MYDGKFCLPEYNVLQLLTSGTKQNAAKNVRNKT